MRYRTLAVALERRAAPAIAVAHFLAAIVAHHRQKHALRRRRSLVAFRLVKRRDEHGRFLKLAPLREELAGINQKLKGAA